MEAPLIHEVHCSSATDLLSFLAPTHEQWLATGGQFCWWFRGESDSSWELVPSAMRRTARWVHRTQTSGIGVIDGLPATTLKEQLEYEHAAFLEFVRVCTECALPVPEDSQWFRTPGLASRALPLRKLSDGVDFPFALHRSVYALAQHYGVQTRLLDWTTNPLVAAYFAVKDVARYLALEAHAQKRDAEDPHKRTLLLKHAPDRPDAPHPARPTWTSDRCAVVALRTEVAFDRLGEDAVCYRAKGRPKLDPYLTPVSAPYDHNPRLRAQRGMFTMLVNRKKPVGQKYRQPSLERLIKEQYAPHSWMEPSDDGPIVLKLTMPHSECRRALRLLAQANMHAGFVFPEYSGVVEATREVGYHV